MLSTEQGKLCVHLLAVLAVHHPHLSTNLILHLSQQKRVGVRHNSALLQPYMDPKSENTLSVSVYALNIHRCF